MSKEKAFVYHAMPSVGKLQVIPTKPLRNLSDLALAYTPGVAAPCHAIMADRQKVYDYTIKGNLVGIITNGTAVLGLGDIGPEGAKPVMEGKVMLMQKLAGVNAFDLEIAEKEPAKLVDIIKAIAPTFGAILLEDIKAPGCFAIERALQEVLDIPVFHDDQHSTSIVIGAALKNALLLNQKKIADLRVVIHGAGASAIASAKLLCSMGVSKANIIMFDSRGVVHADRKNLTPTKLLFATTKPVFSLSEALEGADFFLGLSVGNVLSPEDLLRMASDPIVFALANPYPEIDYKLAHATRQDIIIGTGRSDYPNQVNNVCAFPHVLRGLLDVGATGWNEAIQLAAAEAIASVVHTKEPNKAQRKAERVFSRGYFIPNPLDERLLTAVAPAVAKAAMDTRLARKPIQDWSLYREAVAKRPYA